MKAIGIGEMKIGGEESVARSARAKMAEIAGGGWKAAAGENEGISSVGEENGCGENRSEGENQKKALWRKRRLAGAWRRKAEMAAA